MKLHKHSVLVTAMTAALTLSASLEADIEDNPDYQAAYEGWATAHVSLLPTAFLPGPFGAAADLATIGMDIHIKNLPATLVTADPNAVTPNSPDGCHYSFDLPQKEGEFENILRLFDLPPGLPTDWGALSAGAVPQVGHQNAEVKLRVDNFYLDPWSESERMVVFPSGRHRINWTAATQIDPLFDIVIPAVLFVFTAELKYSDALLATKPSSAARAKFIGQQFLGNAAQEIGLITAGEIFENTVDTALHEQNRFFTVYDVNPPQIEYQPPVGTPDPIVLEANSFGGERWGQYQSQFRPWFVGSDPCDQPVSIGNNAPFLLPLGLNQITWEARDSGPLGIGNPGTASVIQNVLVQDTRAPIILAPPSRVIEADVAPGVEQVDIGAALVFDVADPDPVISNTAPTAFAVNSRTEVLWTATDSSNNQSTKSQWVTIKAPGTNNAPSVDDVAAQTLTSQPVDLVLTGNDPDFLSGRFDPLKFDIVSEPSNGFFVAPLVPYFIEDFRVKPNDELGLIFQTSDNPAATISDQYCDANREIPVDFVYRPEFVHVDDEDISYVLDEYWSCSAGNATARERFSKWSGSGELLAMTDIEASVQRITLDADGFLYAVTPATSSEALFLSRYDSNLNFVRSWKLEDGPPPGSTPRARTARFDSNTGLIYSTDKNEVFIYDARGAAFEPPYLGSLMDGQPFLSGEPSVAGSSNRGFNIEFDSDGAVYVLDSGFDRIHKFNPSGFAGSTFQAGSHIGWLGRCDSGPGCDAQSGHSFGYSCSAATPCEVITADGSNCGTQIAGECTSGSGQSQFDSPASMAMDPEDILYVTDYNNSRVQRFTALGDFAGEAASTCDGTCFVLGDMGRPLDISVNSTKFHVLDAERDIMHVFETAPFKDITENSVVLSYASNNGFQGTDSFTFRADDGLADSNVGTATIDVSRNFRAPEAFDDVASVDEDTSVVIDLLADDPDGIAGIDFNGLDTLSYSVVEAPQYGTLTGSGAMRTYTPNADFNGADRLVFKVNDGLEDSNEAVIDITVNPVNDMPIVRFTDAEAKFMHKAIWPKLEGKIVGTGMEAGLGYPVPLMAEFDDPDPGQRHLVQILWGDGSSDSANQDPPVDPNNPEDEPVITPLVMGTGQVLAKHVYLSTGVFTVDVNVIDEVGAGANAEDAARADITVIPMVDVALEPIVNSEPTNPGQPTSLVIKISNEPPQDPIVGLDATGVVFTGKVPDGVQLLSFATTKGGCTQDDVITTTCTLGTLTPGEEQFVTLLLQPDLDFDPESFGYTIDATSIEPDATKENTTVVDIQVKRQQLFADGFEVL